MQQSAQATTASSAGIGAVKFRPPSVDQIAVGGFFGPRIETIATVTAHTLLDRCVNAGMLDQIDPDRPNPGLRIPYQDDNSTVTTQMFWDSDLGKSIEAAAYALYRRPDPALEARVDEIIDAYGRLQAEDGYLNSWYLRIEPGKRWTNLRDCHELYDAGHLMEGAVAYYHATGKRRFMDIMARYADHIATILGPEPGQKRGYCGHPEIELALVRLARATGERRYLDLARYFVNERGQQPHYFGVEMTERGETIADYHFGTYQYNQSHLPVRDQRAVVGHAVRAAYLYSGMADIATEYGDTSLRPALDALWTHLTARNLYITGGFGPSAQNEGLTFDYDLPNDTAYQETCASVALVFWASRMLGMGAAGHYGDIMEQALYNGALVGLSLDGTQFFYDNPLESRGQHHRWTWHRCPCCPPNITRLVASVGTYMYGIADDAIAVHLYCEGVATLDLPAGKVKLTQRTQYPDDGAIDIIIAPEAPITFTLALRIPGWARQATLKINEEAMDLTGIVENGYARLHRRWTAGDRVQLHLDMPVETVHSSPAIGANQGRVALMRGPLVYCLEGVDNGPSLNSLVLPAGSRFTCEAVAGLADVVGITAEGLREATDGSAPLYSTGTPDRSPVRLKAIPYYAWDNREPGEMLVWIRQEAAQ